jgi:hypothetical protein
VFRARLRLWLRRGKRAMGFEPTTSSLGSWHSTTELRPQVLFNGHYKGSHPRVKSIRLPLNAHKWLLLQSFTLPHGRFPIGGFCGVRRADAA